MISCPAVTRMHKYELKQVVERLLVRSQMSDVSP